MMLVSTTYSLEIVYDVTVYNLQSGDRVWCYCLQHTVWRSCMMLLSATYSLEIVYDVTVYNI